MADAPQKLTCPNCGGPIYHTDEVCYSCGVALDEGRLASEVRRETAAQAAPPTPAIGAALAPGAVAYAAGPMWHPSQVPAGGGLFGSLRRGWIFMSESIQMVFRDKDLVLPSVFSLVANLVILAAVGLIFFATGTWREVFEEEQQRRIWVAALGAGLTLVLYVVTYFFTAMTVHLVDVHLKGRDAQLGSAFADALKNLGALISLAVVSTIVALITSIIRGRERRGLRDMAADALETAWTAVTYLVLPVIILEDVSMGTAFGRARDLHRRNFMNIVVGEIGVRLVTGLVTFLLLVVAFGQAVFLTLLAQPLLPVGIAIGAVLLAIGFAFTAYVRTAFYTCLYLWAEALSQAPEMAPVPVPAPLAAAVAG